VIDAMERISKGDFSIHLEDEPEGGMLRNLNASVNKMASELSQMENMRQEFVSNVSHEIQSPLTSIRGFAEVLQNDQLTPAERRHYLEIIETESRRLSRLADDLLKLASLESDEVKLELAAYALDKQLRSVVLVCEPQWSGKQINIEVDLANVTVLADADLMNQVWLNLLTNSIKFTPAGGSITLKLTEQGDNAIFSIADSGIGIAKEEMVHIFERFYKADKSRTRTKEGSGLGLSIVKRIVEMHHGSIDVESTPDKGTTFTVSLPLQHPTA
jgi:signal transduction histidine kinase